MSPCVDKKIVTMVTYMYYYPNKYSWKIGYHIDMFELDTRSFDEKYLETKTIEEINLQHVKLKKK
jgi:hypothetical protein